MQGGIVIMARYFIETAKYGIGEGGMACGPVVAEVNVKVDNGERFYMPLAEVMGIPNFYKTEESTYALHMNMDAPEEEFEKINEFFLETGEYDEIFGNRDDEYFSLYRYLIYLVRSDWDDYEHFRKILLENG